MRNSAWVALALSFAIIGFFVVLKIVYITVETPDGAVIEANFLRFANGSEIAITGDDATNTVTIATNPVTGSGAVTLLVCSPTALINPTRCDYTVDNTDDDIEIQQAIDRIRNDTANAGGRVMLTEGDFMVCTSINVDGNLIIQGMGIQATIVSLDDNCNTDIFTYNRPDNDFELTIRDMTLHGNKTHNTSGYGINIATGAGTLQDVHLEYVFPQLFAEGGILITNGWGLIIDHCIVEFNDGTGIEVLGGNGRIVNTKIGTNSAAGGAYNLWLRGQEFMVANNQFFSSNSEIGEGIRVSGNRNVITGNDIYNSISQENIFLVGDDNLIANNMIYDGSLGSAYGINANAQAQNNLIMDNKFVGTFSTATVADAGSGNVWRNNMGWATESSGTATITAASTGVAVSHGLDVTPSAGDCWFQGSEAPPNTLGGTWIDSYTASQMELHVEIAPILSGWNVGWSCAVR